MIQVWGVLLVGEIKKTEIVRQSLEYEARKLYIDLVIQPARFVTVLCFLPAASSVLKAGDYCCEVHRGGVEWSLAVGVQSPRRQTFIDTQQQSVLLRCLLYSALISDSTRTLLPYSAYEELNNRSIRCNLVDTARPFSYCTVSELVSGAHGPPPRK